MLSTQRELKEILAPGDPLPDAEWQLRIFQSGQCLSYLVWNTRTAEGIVVDPKREDIEAYRASAKSLPHILWLAVIDTHTHADHISIAATLAEELGAPLIMHAASPSQRVHLRVSKDTSIPSHSGPIQLLTTPGHTPDSITPLWGPFIFGGDTILFGDTGRDDLPGGNPESHYESVQKIKASTKLESIFLPGHDHRGGRASTWKKQLEINASLTQPRDVFVKEAAAFSAPAPENLNESLRENFK